MDIDLTTSPGLNTTLTSGIRLLNGTWRLAAPLIPSALAMVAVTAPSQTPTPQKPGVAGVQFPISAFIPDAQYAIAGGPDWLAVSEDMVWANARQQSLVARMNPSTCEVVARVSMPKPCSGLIIGANNLRAPSCGDNALYGIDLTINKAVGKIAAAPANTEGGIAFGAAAF